MLSPEALEYYRRLTPGERLSLSFQATREALRHLAAGPPDIVDRRFARIRQQNELFNERMLSALAEATARAAAEDTAAQQRHQGADEEGGRHDDA